MSISGIYFEANGHGTVLFSDTAIDTIYNVSSKSCHTIYNISRKSCDT